MPFPRQRGKDPQQQQQKQQPPEAQQEIPIKLVVVGGAAAGKTAIVHRFKKREFQDAYVPTIGFNVNTFQLTKAIQKQNLDICLQIWDVSHVELTGYHLQTIFESASGVLMVVDPTKSNSLQALDSWREVIVKHLDNADVPITLAISKTDLCKEAPTSTASIIASSLALSAPSSFASFFGVPGDSKKESSESSGKGKKESFGPRLQDLTTSELQLVMDQYCELAGIHEWKKCSSKTGKNVKDALYSLVNLSLQPLLESRQQEIHLQEYIQRQQRRDPESSIFSQTWVEIPWSTSKVLAENEKKTYGRKR